MDRFDYKVSGIERYISSGLTPGNLPKPVAWGSKSSFIGSISEDLIEGNSVQLIAEPIKDNVEIIRLAGVKVVYLYNGVYLVTAVNSGVYSSDYTSEYPELNPSVRVAANTGPVAIKLTNLNDDIQVVIDGIPVSYQKGSQSDNTLIVSENVAYDKFIVNYDGDLNELIDKTPRSSVSDSGMLRPLSYDKLYEPKLITAEEMFSVDDYYVTSRKLSNANTSVEFYSDLNQIQKSDDGEEWLPVQKIEYHGDDATIFRSKDKQFALRFYDTTVKEFVILGAVTAVEGEIYKNGDNIGSYFSHDCYKIQGGSLRVISEGLTSVTILGHIPESVIDSLHPMIDYGYQNEGKMHLYTFEVSNSLEIEAEAIYVSAIGVNLNHFDVMDHIVGASQMSYADEIHSLEDGQSMNGENEYSILDLQWNV